MLQKCNLWNVAAIFFDRPDKEFELMEISRLIQLAHTSVKKHLLTLIDLDIVKTGTVNFGNKTNPYYVANRRHYEFIHYKKLYNLDKIKQSGMLKYIETACEPNCIVLFGSYQRGEDVLASDIDLFVECSEQKLKLKQFEQMLNRKIQLHFKKDFKMYSKELKNNISNGTVLFGYLEVFNA